MNAGRPATPARTHAHKGGMINRRVLPRIIKATQAVVRTNEKTVAMVATRQEISAGKNSAVSEKPY